LADEIDALRNFHFRDDVSDGRMTFDYLLRPGPCPTTNALKIMSLEGLPTGDAGSRSDRAAHSESERAAHHQTQDR
jgi:DNA mismatch repair ATPase MutS